MEERKYTKYSLHHIKEVKSLEELGKYYKDISKYAKMIRATEDTVQNFYLKMFDYFKKNPEKTINGGFIVVTLKNLLIDEQRYNKRFDLGTKDKTSLEINEKEVDVPVYIDSHIYELTDEDLMTMHLDGIIEEHLSEEEKILLELTFDMNLSEISRATEISYSNLRYEYLKIKRKIQAKYEKTS